MNRSNKAWVKHMCQRLEGIRTDIDKFVCKEPVSFVGNQMETVGANVKNFFSGVVNDFGLAQVVDPVCIAQFIPSKHIDVFQSSTISVVDVKDNAVDSNTNKPEKAPLVPEVLCHNPSSIDLLPSDQITVESSQHLIGKRESLIYVASDNTTAVRLNTYADIPNHDNRFEDNAVDSNTNKPEEAPSVPEELCHNPSSIDLLPSDQVTAESSQHLIGEMESLIYETSDNTTAVHPNTYADIPNLDNRFKESICYDESLHGDATESEHSGWGIENIFDLNLNIDNMAEGEPLMNLEEKQTNLNSSPVDELECDLNNSTTHHSSEPQSSVTCNENQEENSKDIISCGLSSENIYESVNSSFRNFTVKPDTTTFKPTETVDFFSVSSDDFSSCASFTTIACDRSDEAVVSCSGTGLANGSMVDFYDINFDSADSGVIVESEMLSLFPNKSKSKSYKRMIQDAFMSRNRITKEYKQLAIQYGDVDKELWKPTKISKTSVRVLPDSEWELL